MKFCAIAIAFILVAFSTVHPASAEGPEASVYMRTKEVGATGSDAASALIARARGGGTVSVIVTLDQTIDAEPDARPEAFRTQQMELFAAQDQLVSRIHFGRKRLDPADRFETVPMLVMDVSEAELNRLMRDPKVISLELNRKITLKPRLEEMRAMTNIEQIWGPGRSDKGNGETIVIIDDGVDSAHPAIKGRVIEEKCISGAASCFDPVAETFSKRISSGESAAWTCDGALPSVWHPKGRYCISHGMQVTGVAAGARGAKSYDGFGPRLNIVFIRLSLDDTTIATYSKAFEMAYTSAKLNIAKVITTSIGLISRRSTRPCGGQVNAFDTIIKKIRAGGIVVTNSAGNDKSDTEIDFPACHPDVLAVGASTDKTDNIPAFSDLSYMVDFLSPGDDVLTGPSAKMTAGSSFSTPSVAATLALMHRAFPAKSMDAIVTGLRCGGNYLNRPGTIVSAPRIDADTAYDILNQPKIKQNFEYAAGETLAKWNIANGGWTLSGGTAIWTPVTTFSASALYNDLCLDDFTAEMSLREVVSVPADQFPTVRSGIVLNYLPKGDLKQAGKQPINGYFFLLQRTLGANDTTAIIFKATNCVMGVPGGCGASQICFVPAAQADITTYNTLSVTKAGKKLRFSINGTQYCETTGDDDRFRSAGIWSASGKILSGPDSGRRTIVDYLRFTAK